MTRPSTWSELDRLARFVRASDALSDTLALWTGRGVTVEILRQVDGACPDPLVADALELHDGARVQDRSVLMRCGDLVVAAARSLVAVGSPALTAAIRTELQGLGDLDDPVRPLHHRRVAVQVTAGGAGAEPGHPGRRGRAIPYGSPASGPAIPPRRAIGRPPRPGRRTA